MNDHDVLIDIGTTIGQTPRLLQERISSKLCTILRSKATTEVFIRLCRVKADTHYVLTKEFNIPPRTAYNALERLRELDVIAEARPMGLGRKGARASVFALKEHARGDAISEAVERYRFARTPAYAEVKRLTQLRARDLISEAQIFLICIILGFHSKEFLDVVFLVSLDSVLWFAAHPESY